MSIKRMNIAKNMAFNYILVELLKNKKMTISFAESCTGGLASAGIVDVPGASEVFYGSVVSYDNSIKANVIDVSLETLNTVGPVSDECAREMAIGVRNKIGSDIAISITGIAGPGGAEEGKPVGTVYFGYADSNGSKSIRLQLSGDRDAIRKAAAMEAYKIAIKELSSVG